MSAREKLSDMLGYTAADEILGAHAVELAELILNHATNSGYGCGDCREESCYYFAELIAPHSTEGT